jgi:dolichyl-phosphate beta-glucosyltransferase
VAAERGGGARDVIRLSVVVPAYNEEARIVPTLRRIREYLSSQPYSSEIVVVDDGSRDETALVARRELDGLAAGQVIRYTPNRGKGFAVRTGVVATNGELVLFTDADLSTPIEEVERAFGLMRDGYDVVVGSRAIGRVTVRQPLYRRSAARVFNLIRDVLVGRTGVVDTQCGFKLFRGDVGRDIFRRQRIDRFMFDVETLAIARNLGYRYVEMPVQWGDVPGSKVRVIHGALELLPELLQIRLRHGHLRPSDARPGG